MNLHTSPFEQGGADLLLPGFDSILVDHSPDSVTELERKYDFPGEDIDGILATNDAFVCGMTTGLKPRFVAFSGVDYYRMIERGERKLTLRYRTGQPKHNLLCIKLREGDHETLRREIEVNFARPSGITIDEADELLIKKAKGMFDILASLSMNASEFTSCEVDIRVKGNIRFVPVPSFPGREIELVVYTGLNLATGKAVSVAEIEAHRFDIHTQRAHAEAAIDEWEERLGWSGFRTNKSMVELLS